MLHKVRAIVLQRYETGDTSGVVRAFCAERGRLSLMAKGLRAPKSRLAGVLQPLATAELTFHLHDGAEMGTLRDAAAIDERAALHDDLERLALGSLLAEVAAESCEHAQESAEMFDALERGLDALLPTASRPAPTTAMHFLLRIVGIAGYEPSIDETLLAPWPADRAKPAMFWLNVEEGRVHADFPQPSGEPRWPMLVADNAREIPLPPECVRAVYVNAQTPTNRLDQLPAVPSDAANQLVDGLVRLAQWHMGHAVRSARFWRSIT